MSKTVDSDAGYLIEAIERSFGVTFDEGELRDDSTLNDVFEALQRHLGPATPDLCFSSTVFWRLRRGAVDLLGVPKQTVTPWSPVHVLFPAMKRRNLWRALSETTGLQLPTLIYPDNVKGAIGWIALLLTAIAGVMLENAAWPPLPTAVLMILALVLLISLLAFLLVTLSRLCQPLATELPLHGALFRDLVRTTVGLNYGTLSREFGRSNDKELRSSLLFATSEITGVHPYYLDDQSITLFDLAENGVHI